MSETSFDGFNSQYSLSKTLRFELRPVGGSKEHLGKFKSKFLQDKVKEDRQRAEYYKQIKPIIDDCHREYIESSLRNPGKLSASDIDKAYDCYQKLRDSAKNRRQSPDAFKAAQKAWEDMQKRLRGKLAQCFENKEQLFKKELITETIPERLEKEGRWEENRDCVKAFDKFTSYFTGFHKNRKNMYVADAKSTAIAFRLMNENLPRFFSNCMAFAAINEKYPDLTFDLDPEVVSSPPGE